MDILESLKFAAAVSSVVFLLLETGVVVEYGELFGLKKILNLGKYKCHRIQNPSDNYFSFLKHSNNCFLTRLISCPYCVGFWGCALSGLYECNVLVTYFCYIIFIKIIIPKNE
jgi:hypothetical protein